MGNRLPRKLAAILYADVAGYSRLTGEDEDATHRRLSEYLDLISATVEDHEGRVMHYAGDAVLAMFDAVVDAVSCATEFQDKLQERNQELPTGRKVQFRIGVNLGDVIEDRGDIYGDGVNVAARLESLADPGGICISDAVRSAIGKKLDLDCEDLGEQDVKNIAEPVRAHRVLWKSEKAKADDAVGGRSELALPERPSIAVLPFENMSADPEQEFFADGITEDLLTKLTSILGLFVIARNSSFRYKGTTADVRQISEELGVRYVLEGRVRTAANRVRVTAQLIEAATGSHLWAELYDRDLTDVFAVQDDISVNVVKALQVTLLEGEQARIWHRSTNNVEAWSCLTRAKACHTDHMALEENRAGIELLERAVELDPDYASAWSWLGWLLIHEVRFFWTDQPKEVLARVAECAHNALALDESLAEAHSLLGLFHLLDGDYAQAVAAAERGVALGPNNADVAALLAYNLNWVGRPEEALVRIEKAMRFSPAFSSWFAGVKAHALRLLGRFDEAVKAYRASVSETPAYLSPRVGLTVCYAEMGRKTDARGSARKLLELEPKFSIERYIRKRPEYKDRALTDRTAKALREAGLPTTAGGAKLRLSSEDMGEQKVKNIAEPVRTHGVLSKSQKTEMHSAPGGTTAPEFPEKPSIAVLPFENMGADPEQEIFADGIAQDLLTKLTSILGLFVIARKSSFQYKGRAVDVRQVAEELGVRYVLEGSVRKADSRVRVTAQLIEAATGSQLWAERYDRDSTDVFAVQDEIAVNVVKALQVTLLEGEQARIWHRSTDNLEAWSCLTQAKAHFDAHLTVQENRAGMALLERAVELDPNYASAWSWLGWFLLREVRFFWTDEPADVMTRVAECTRKALALDENLAEAHSLLGYFHLLDGVYDQAVAAAERGVALGPSNADVVALLAFNLNWVGRPREALVWIEKAMRLNPVYSSWFVNAKAHALRLLGRFEEAVEAYRSVISENPAFLIARIGLTVCYAEMGRRADAQESAGKLLELDPKFSIERYIHTPGYKDRALTEHTAEALREAGLPTTAAGAKLGLRSEDMGEQKVENIAEPVRTHRVLSKSEKKEVHSTPGGTTAPELPEKSSILVLPFENTSGNPEQQYFADGITENIITGLTRFRDLSVIAVKSAFAARERTTDMQQIARQLGVAHVVEGSVRKAVNRVRVTAQLIDATSGQSVWAEHYDRDLDDIFVVQDEITNIIVATLAGRIEKADRHRAEHKAATDMAAYDYWLRGRQCLNRYTKKGELEARRHFERSLELDPGYAAAYAGLAVSYIHEYYASWSETPHEALDRAYELSQEAVELDDADSTARYGLAQAYFAKHQPELAKIQIEKALALNPNDYHNICSKGWYLALSGERVEGIACSNEAIRLNPFAPDNCLLSIGVAEYVERRYEAALAAFGKIGSSGLVKPACLAACYAKLGRDQQARAAATEVLKSAKTELAIQLGEDAERWHSYWVKQFPFQNPDDFEHLLGGLRKAGLPG